MAKKKDQEKHKEKGIVLEGTVEEALPNAVFRVKLDTGTRRCWPMSLER
jgi:translation initiation factor IF-1